MASLVCLTFRIRNVHNAELITKLVKRVIFAMSVFIVACAFYFAIEFIILINDLYSRCPTRSDQCSSGNCNCTKIDAIYMVFRVVLGIIYIILDIALIISYCFMRSVKQDLLASGSRKDINCMYFVLVLIFTISTFYILIFG